MQTTAAGGSRSGSGDDSVGEIDGGDGVDGGDDHGDARPSGDAAHLPRASSYGSARIAGGTAEGALYSEEETTPRSVSVSCSALFDEVLRCEHLPERAVVLGLLDKYTSHQISPLETIPTLERKVSRYFSPCAKIIIFRVCQTPFFVDITGRFCLAGLWARRCSNRRHSSPRIARGGGGGQTGLPIGWLRYVDAQSGRRYFYHLHTRRTTWAIPRGAQDGRDGGRDVEVAAIGDTRVRRDAKAIWDEAEVPQESAAIARRILSEVSDSERKSDGEVSEEEVADESSSWSAAGMGFKLSLAKLKREAIDDDRPNAFHVKHPPHLISPKPPSTSTPHCHPPNTT